MPTRKLHLKRSNDSNENILMVIHELLLYTGNNVLEAHMPGLLAIFNDFSQCHNFTEVNKEWFSNSKYSLYPL